MVGHGRCTCGSEKWREAEDTGEVVLRNRVHQGRKGQKAKLCGRCCLSSEPSSLVGSGPGPVRVSVSVLNGLRYEWVWESRVGSVWGGCGGQTQFPTDPQKGRD